MSAYSNRIVIGSAEACAPETSVLIRRVKGLVNTLISYFAFSSLSKVADQLGLTVAFH